MIDVAEISPRHAAALQTADAQWAALVRRDPGADGAFWYSVRTTGVYCRPSCGARLPRRENVRFHASPAEAEKAGFRPCKRCRPDQPSDPRVRIVENACRTIENIDASPDLNALAAQAGMSRFHFHRVFKAITGVTPKAYAKAHRADRVRGELARSPTVTSAIYDAGFNSNGSFYSASPALLGMTPGQYRAGAPGQSIRFAVGECSLGAILVAASDKGVCSIALGDDAQALVQDLENRFSKARLVAGDAAFNDWVAKIVGFVETPSLGLDLPLDVRGTAFQHRVWQALRQIPCGETASYAQIAERVGAPKAVRAVAQACAANPLAVAIPCHRVVRQDGGLSGYRWGVERKRALLDRESNQ
jgi:AraC family transcriptional regulator of adaptative response/methylated-DNA-[protein]-cysteine methyltransferase